MQICIFPLCLSFCPIHLLFIQTFQIYQLRNGKKLWCQSGRKQVNNRFRIIIIPHIHTYKKKNHSA